MKLIRFGEPGKEKPGLVLDSGKLVDASGHTTDYNEAFFAEGGLNRLKVWAQGEGSSAPELDPEIRLGPPIARPSKIVCIGLNYADHAKESNLEPPAEPVVFFKATSAFCGPNDDTIIPLGSQKTDWEVELAVVIGKKASYVSEADAYDYIAGYMVHNDYSEREWQLEKCGQWVKGKSADTFAPCGPFLATPDEVGDVHNLGLWLKVNGEKVQDGNTANLIFNIPHLIAYLSRFMSLLPGDIISTGTPAGVGFGFNPKRFLKPGDEVELGIEGLGEQKQKLVGMQS